MTIQQTLQRTIANPQRLFVLDGFGALLSAILLGVVLVRLESVFGIPRQTLYLLAALPCIFAVYDFYCFYKINKNTGAFLKGIAIANLLYCLLSLGLVAAHRAVVTTWGWVYIITEIIIVCGLAWLELKVAGNWSSDTT